MRFQPFLLLAVLFGISAAYTTLIHAPAVLSSTSTGTLTEITLNLTAGTGVVSISGPSSVGYSTIASAKQAVATACSYLGVNQSQYNFSFVIHDRNVSVSGPSAGTAFTLLTIAALEHRQLLSNFTVSGIIESNGTIGLIGGVYDKAEAASQGHMRFFLLPNATAGGTIEQLLYYISQSLFSIPIQQVSNISQALTFAFGIEPATPMQYNITQHFELSKLSTMNLSCTSCNTSAFDELVNFTLNFTSSEISSVPSVFNQAKAQMLANQQRYEEIASKGYAYTAADFAFLQYLQAFTLANKANYTATGASSVLSNVATYCSSLVPPLLTNANYEYVIGGELRQDFANETLEQAEALLSSPEVTSDSYIEALYYGAEALAWCKAAQELYNISASLPGNYVSLAPVLKQEAASAIAKAEPYGANLYLDTAVKSFDAGNYAEALYAAAYASALANPLAGSNMTSAQLVNATLANIDASLSGIWPYEFAGQALFYLNEYRLGQSNDLKTAYTTSLLAKSIEQANIEIAKAFIISNFSQTSPMLLQQVSELSNEISMMFYLMLIMVILLACVLIVLLAQLVRSTEKDNSGKNKRVRQR
ncbi:MAG: S16 family serine protease [Candidatus Micrarchaeia archaeon]